jgi:hypothetical protein
VFPHHNIHCNIHKDTCTSPNEKTHSDIDYILIDRFAALEDLDAEVDINSAWETTSINENIKISGRRVWIFTNLQIREGLTEDTENYWMKENKPNCSCCRTQVK